MTETNQDGFWSAIEALGGQSVPPSLQAAVAEVKEKVHQLELDFDSVVQKAEAFVAGVEAEPVVAEAEAKPEEEPANAQ